MKIQFLQNFQSEKLNHKYNSENTSKNIFIKNKIDIFLIII